MDWADAETNTGLETDGNTLGKSKFPKIVRNICLNIDQQVFFHLLYTSHHEILASRFKVQGD